MVFRRSRKGLVIDSVKHEIRFSDLLANGGSVKNTLIASGVNTQDIAADNHVKTGSLVKAIFFEVNFNFEGNVTATADWAIVKKTQGQALATEFNPSIPNQPTRAQVFLWGMEMPAGINNSSAVKRIGTLLIPKGKQRMREGDQWQFVYFTTAGAGAEDVCGHFIYKEYR